MDKCVEMNLISNNELKDFLSFELISPRSILDRGNHFGLRKNVVEAILWCLSYKSSIYVNISCYNSYEKNKIKEPNSIINMVNQNYLNFELARTKYRRGSAMS